MRKILSLVIAMVIAMMPVGAICETSAETETPAAEATEVTQEVQETEAPAVTEEAQEAAETAEPTVAPTPTPDPNSVMASVDGEDILYSEVEDYFDMIASQYSSYIDVTDESVRSILMEQALNYAIQLKVVEHKATELGLDQLTEEEIAALDQQAEAAYDETVATYTSYYTQSGTDAEAAKIQAMDFLEGYDYTLETLKEQYKLSEIIKRVQASVTDTVTVSDEDVKAAFDEKVASQKETYDASPAAFCTAKISGDTIYYTPESIRTVKHILIAPEKIDEINELKSKIAAEDTSEEDKTAAQTDLDAILAETQPKLDEIMEKVKAGEDFQTLIDTYGEDPGMKAGATNAETGYYVCEGASFDEAFLNAALALEKVGDVSEPVLGSYGYHIIRYESDVPSGAVEYDSVKEALSAETLSTKQSEAFSTALTEWQAAANVVTSENG